MASVAGTAVAKHRVMNAQPAAHAHSRTAIRPGRHRSTYRDRTPSNVRVVTKTDPDQAPSVLDCAPVLERGEFETTCMPHREELFAGAMRMTRSPDDAHDLVQETMMRAYMAWDRFVPGSNCRAWLFRILTNSFINIYRKRRRHQRFATECPADAVAALYGNEQHVPNDPESCLMTTAFSDEVAAALDTLAPDYRTVVELADLHGIRYRDIAESLGVPIGTVMSRLFRARRQLEAQLGDFAATDYGIRRAA